MLKKHNSMWPLRCLSGSHFKNGRLQLLETPPFQPPRSQLSLPCSPPIGYPSLGHAPFLCKTAGLRPMDWCIRKAPFRLGPGLGGACLATGHLLPTPASALPFHRGVPSECSHKLPTDKPLHCSGPQGVTACDMTSRRWRKGRFNKSWSLPTCPCKDVESTSWSSVGRHPVSR